MSPSRRSAAAGTALAVSVSVLFVTTTTAQAASAAGSRSASAHSTAADRPSSDGASAQAGYKSFSSTAKKPGVTRTASGGRALPSTAKAADAATTIYVLADPTTCTSKELGAGTTNDPYCMLQSAVNEASSGDTIEVFQNDDETYGFAEPVTINGKSGITIIGESIGVGDVSPDRSSAMSITNSSNITVRGLVLNSPNDTPTVNVTGSQNITFDGDSLVSQGGASSFETVNVATSSGVTISRSAIGSSGGGLGVIVGNKSSNIVLASDVMSTTWGGGVEADGVNGLDIVGDTIQRGCTGGVIVDDTGSADISIQDNVFQEGSFNEAACAANSHFNYGPDVSVDSIAAPAVTTDYNDFTLGSANDTDPYGWAGTEYATLDAFQAAVSQGANDALDPTADAEMFLTPAGMSATGAALTADAQPTSTSLSIGTANTSAPGYLSSDFNGTGSYHDRGAIEYSSAPLTAVETVYQDGARTVEDYADTSVEPDAYATYVYMWGDGSTTSSTTQAWVAHTYAHPGDYDVTVAVTDVFGNTSSTTAASTTLGSDFVPLTPSRLLDTRKGTGTSGVVAPIAAGKSLALQITGVDSIPSNATAVALNLTATDATASGHLNAYPSGSAVPVSSNLDFAKGKNVANMSIVPIGTGGVVEFYNGSSGSVDLIADVSGYFVTAQADGYKQVVPARILDTRTSTGGHKAPLTPSAPVKLKVAGVGGVPTDAKAVEVNLTVASPTTPSYVVAYPDGGTKPTVSNVNFTTGQAIANAAIVPIGSDGYIDIATPVGSNRMIVDVDGYFSANLTEAPSAYEPVTPFRWLDTRTNGDGPLKSYFYYWIPFGLDRWGNVINQTVTGAVVNATVTGVTAVSGDLDSFPDNYINGNLDIPSISSLNFTKGATVANLVFATTGTDGKADFLNNSGGNVQLIIDVFGYFQSS